MTSIPDAAAQFLAHPAPVLIVDTCNFLDLFRRDTPPNKPSQPRVPAEEVQSVLILLSRSAGRSGSVHLVVPELVPDEFAFHADRIEEEFEGWLEAHDRNRAWLDAVASLFGITLPAPTQVFPGGLHSALRAIAASLLSQAVVLDRDRISLDRAVERLIARRRPSHKKEIKDSMNLEQGLELGARLRAGGFAHRIAFISSNTDDYATKTPGLRLHPDLDAEFAAISMEYFTSLRAACGALKLL